jgi:hypothetical protein
LNLTAQVIDPPDQSLDHLLAVAAGEMLCAEVLVFDAIFQHVVPSGEHGGGDGEDRLLRSPTGPQSMELGLQIGVFDAHGGPGSSNQCRFEPGSPLAYTGRAALAGTFIAAGTQSGPRDQMRRGGETLGSFADDHVIFGSAPL